MTGQPTALNLPCSTRVMPRRRDAWSRLLSRFCGSSQLQAAHQCSWLQRPYHAALYMDVHLYCAA
jgi:hypothetical protein